MVTDMRATERLLEVIEAHIDRSLGDVHEADIEGQRLWSDAEKAITELRRRGDTLVRRDDLRMALEVRASAIGTTATADTMHRAEAMRRLENAIGS